MNDQYKYFEKTLTPNIARELIQELFAGQTVQKQEIMRVVVEKHLERGGLPTIAQRNNPVTLGLWHMKREGQADSSSGDNWVIPTSSQDDESVDAEQDDLDPEKIIGSGKQAVYLYYYPAYQRLAELQGKEIWACKIGKSRNDPVNRIVSQTRTALPEFPEVGLIIKTDQLNLMEKTIQNILKLRGKQMDDAPGKEWFITSPSEVERVYECIFENL
ncbi:GIY-YIG nuclease family protein [Candidatus Poribacteria bacterium]|nr:GIY-YIG nuclease family protein [Candidatus Poribacteria bacterium]